MYIRVKKTTLILCLYHAHGYVMKFITVFIFAQSKSDNRKVLYHPSYGFYSVLCLCTSRRVARSTGLTKAWGSLCWILALQSSCTVELIYVISTVLESDSVNATRYQDCTYCQIYFSGNILILARCLADGFAR